MPLELLQPVLTLVELAANGTSLVSGISNGRQLNSILRQVQTLNGRVQTLSDRILYAPSFELLENIEQRVVRVELGQRQIRELLEPIQNAVGDVLLASRLIQAPNDFAKEMVRDPWHLLIDIRPLGRITSGIHRDKVPVMFFENQIPFVGWIDPRVLVADFKLKYRAELTRSRNERGKKTFIDMRTSRMGYVDVFTHTTRTFSVACCGCSKRFFVTLVSNENYVVCPDCHREQILNISWPKLRALTAG